MKLLIFTLGTLLLTNLASLALEAKSLLGEWLMTVSYEDEDGMITTVKEITLFLPNGEFYSEGLLAFSDKEDNIRFCTIGGPSKGKWSIKDNQLHQTADKVTIEFFSSITPELNRDVFRNLFVEQRDTASISSLKSKTTTQLIFKDIEDGSLTTYTRRKTPKDQNPAWDKLLTSYPVSSLGNAPDKDKKNKNDPAGERFRRYSNFHLENDGFSFSSGLPTYKNRPFKGKLRPKEEIAARILCNYLCWAFVYLPEESLSTRTIETYLEKHKIKNKLTKKEKQILSSNRKNAQENYGNAIGWKLENTWALAWVLGFEQDIDIDQLPFGEATAPDLQEFMMKLATNPKEFLKTCKTRSLVEVIQTEDVFYCAHNAIRSAQIGRKGTIPPHFHPIQHGGIIHEKRHALTWVLSPGVSWDETDLST